MQLKINGVDINIMPAEFTATVLDLDDGESTARTVDGTLNRDRVAVKRQVEMKFNAMIWSDLSALLNSMSAVFFDFYYPDPMTGTYVTKKMYVGNRPAPIAIDKGGILWWKGLTITLTER